jgi:hypothetical protein
MKHVLLVILLTIVATRLASAGQTLADLAKQEEARRKTVKAPGKIYTNDTLKDDITKSAVPPSGDRAVVPAPSTQVPEVNLPGGKVEPTVAEKDEAKWRERMSAARSTLERSRIFADALQSRLNSLATDIVNRADPAQRSLLELERQRATAELDRVKREIVDQTKAITDIEDEARKAGVPPGWLR